MADECEYLSRCPIWEKFKTDSKYAWIARYCKGSKKDKCARKALRKEGKEVPINLLPNGKTLTRL